MNTMNKKTTIIGRYDNKDEGTAVVIAEVSSGFSVALLDTDADMYVPTVVIYPTRERAFEAARRIAKVA